MAMAFSPMANLSLEALCMGRSKVWAVALRKMIATLNNHGTAFSQWAFSPDGRYWLPAMSPVSSNSGIPPGGSRKQS